MPKKDTHNEPVEDQSLDEALREAFGEIGGDDDTDTEDQTPEDDGEGSQEPESDGDEGEGVEPEENGEDAQEGEGQEAESDGEGEGEVEPLEPPQHWAAEDRDTFAGVPREAQEFLLKRHKDMEADYTRKTQEVASARRQFEEQQEIMAPISQDLALAGADANAFIRQQVAWAQAFKADPRAALGKLAGAYGLDVAQLSEGQEEVDPTVQAMQQELANIRANQQQSLQAQQQTEQQRLLQSIEDFSKATDDTGNLRYPHFKEIQQDMGREIQAGLATGLEDAYARVVAIKGLKAPEPKPATPPKKEASQDRKAKVRRAKRAATGVKSSGTPAKQANEDLSLVDEISSLYDSFS